MDKQTLYLELRDQVTSVLQKIKRTGDADVLLVAPTGAKLFQNLSSLRLLKIQLDKLGKRVSVATADARGAQLVKRAGFIVENKLEESVAQKTSVSPNPSRRIGDIFVAKKKRPLPPAANKKIENKKLPEKELSALIGPEKREQEIRVPQKTRIPLRHYRKIIIPTITGIVILAVLVLFVFPSAAITVTSRSEQINRDLELLVDQNIESVDIQNLVVPGTLVTEEVVESKTFTSTGKNFVGERATGEVSFRNFSGNSLILRKNTTRLEVNGKTYELLQDVGGLRPTLRQGSGENAPIDESTLVGPVGIIALEPGTGANVPAGTRFEVHNEVFGHQPEFLFAVSVEAIGGGTDETETVVSEDDVNNARQEIGKSILERLSGRLTGGIVLSENAAAIEVLEESLTHQVGAVTAEFQVTHSTRIRALLYNTADVQTLMADRIIKLLPDNKHLVDDDSQSLEGEFVSLDIAAGTGTLQAHYNATIQYSVSRDFLSQGLRGKTESEVKEILLSRPEVQDVKVNLSPFWVTRVPYWGGRVELTVVEAE